MARLQDRAVPGRAPSASMGLRPGGDGGALRVVVFAPRATAARAQPEDRLSRAGYGPRPPAPAVLAELSRSRQGLRRPDAAAPGPRRGDAAQAQGHGLGVPRGRALARQ